MKNTIKAVEKPAAAGMAHPALKTAQQQAIQRLKVCERGLAEIYAVYSQRFAGAREFWAALSAEERSHEGLFDNILRWVEEGHVIQDLGRVAGKEIVATLTSAIDREQRRLSEGLPVSEAHAFEQALAFESSLADNHFFDLARCEHPDFKSIAKILNKASIRHRDSIVLKMLERRKATEARPSVVHTPA